MVYYLFGNIFYFNEDKKSPGRIRILLDTGMLLTCLMDPDPQFRITDPRIRIRKNITLLNFNQKSIKQAKTLILEVKSTVPHSAYVQSRSFQSPVLGSDGTITSLNGFESPPITNPD